MIYLQLNQDNLTPADATLEGTVRKSQMLGCFVLDTLMPGNDVHSIRYADLDPATSSLVESLLAAQGGAE